MAELTREEIDALSTIAKAVIQDPDLVDELIGDDSIAIDPEELALRLIFAAAQSPQNFDSTRNFGAAAVAGVVTAATKVAGLFKNKDKADKGTGFLSNVIGNIKDKIGDWRDNRELKKDLKDSGDPNWRDTYKELKNGGKPGTGALDPTRGDRGGGGNGDDDTAADTVATYRASTGSTTGSTVPGSDQLVLPPGMTIEQIEAGLKQLEKQEGQIKTWKWVSIGLGVLFVSAVIYILVAGNSENN